MNYYNEIKNKLINNEVYKKVKDYSKNRSDLNTYYNVGKLLIEAQGGEERAKYGNGLIKEYSKKLVIEVGRTYNERTLRRIRQFYIIFKDIKWSPLATKITWSHYCELLSINDLNIIKYYLKIIEEQNLSKREIRNKIKNKYNYEEISEKILKKIILEDISSFMKELGQGFSFIDSEYKIKLGDRYNYIDLLLFNIEFNCYVDIELKITELKKEYIGQIQTYMNYIDKNLKKINQNKTIGIIICKKDNRFIMEYCSDNRIYRTTYELINI